MPCCDPDPENRPEYLRKKVNYLTDLLCQLCRATEHTKEFPRGIAEWWQDHQQTDIARKKAKAKFQQLKDRGHPTPFWELTEDERNLVWFSE